MRRSSHLLFFILLAVYISSCPWAATSQSSGNEEILVRIGVYDGSPLVWMSEDLRPQGLGIDLLKQIADEQDWQLRFHPGIWAEKLQELESGHIDILPWSSIATQRTENFIFTEAAEFSNLGQLSEPLDISFAISRKSENRETLKSVIDSRLTEQKPDLGSLDHQSLSSSWKSESEREARPVWVQQILTITIIGLVMLLAGTFILRWRIQARTSELEFSEKRFRELFEATTISLLEEDLTKVLQELQKLRNQGIKDLANYFMQYPGKVTSLVRQLKIVSANSKTLDMFGAKTLEQLESGLLITFTRTSLKTFEKGLLAIYAQQTHFSDETEFLTLHGKSIRVMISFPIPANLEQASRVPFSMLDITQQYQTEIQLTQVIEGASLGFWDWNLQTGRHIVNDRWLSMLGLSRDDIKNDASDWSERINPEDRKRIEPIVKQHIEQAQPYVVEFRMRHKDGHWVWIQGSGNGVDYDPNTNQPLRACGTHQDITERKRSEEALHTLVESMVGISGQAFFVKVTHELCRWLDADGAVVGELINNQRIRAISTLLDGDFKEDFE